MRKIMSEVAELEVLAIYESATRQETVDYIQDAMAFVDAEDKEILALMASATDKLSQISDMEYEQMNLSSYLHDQEDVSYED
jgi:hypothetical protein